MCLRALQLQPEIPRKPHVPPVGAGVAERAEYCSGFDLCHKYILYLYFYLCWPVEPRVNPVQFKFYGLDWHCKNMITLPRQLFPAFPFFRRAAVTVSSAVMLSSPGMSRWPRRDRQKGPRARACGTQRLFHGG